MIIFHLRLNPYVVPNSLATAEVSRLFSGGISLWRDFWLAQVARAVCVIDFRLCIPYLITVNDVVNVVIQYK